MGVKERMNITLLIGLVLGFGGVVAGYVIDEGVLSALIKPMVDRGDDPLTAFLDYFARG